jgi:hypothetical protein
MRDSPIAKSVREANNSRGIIELILLKAEGDESTYATAK